MKKNEVVVSLGGSVLIEDSIDTEFIHLFSRVFKENVKRGAVVVGGGRIARQYIKAIEELGGSEIERDGVAIEITRANALLVNKAIEGKFITHPDKAIGDKYYVSGGFFPGLTTDSCSVLLAEKLGIKKLINISNVDGIYDKDPNKYEDAKKYDELSFEEFEEMAKEKDKRKAGTHFIFDYMALKLANRANIEEIHFIGKDVNEFERALKGKKHGGTIVMRS